MGLSAQLDDLLEDVHSRGVKAVTLQGRSKQDTSKPTGAGGPRVQNQTLRAATVQWCPSGGSTDSLPSSFRQQNNLCGTFWL